MWISKRGTYFKFDVIFRIQSIPVNYAYVLVLVFVYACAGCLMNRWVLKLLCILLSQFKYTQPRQCVCNPSYCCYCMWCLNENKTPFFFLLHSFINGNVNGKAPLVFSFKSKFSINLLNKKWKKKLRTIHVCATNVVFSNNNNNVTEGKRIITELMVRTRISCVESFSWKHKFKSKAIIRLKIE